MNEAVLAPRARRRQGITFALIGLSCIIAPASAAPTVDATGPFVVIEEGFHRFDPLYARFRSHYAAKLAPLAARVLRLEKEGRDLSCSAQIVTDARWYLAYTADWPALEQRLEELRASLEQAEQRFARDQSSVDGSWGACYTQWFEKVDWAVEEINNLAAGNAPGPRYPLAFLDPVSTPEKLIAYLADARISDVAETGIDRRSEFGAVTTAISQFVFKDDLREYINKNVRGLTITDAYVDAYRKFVDEWQDPTTGYWGAWYRQDGKIYRTPDVSLTYHTIAYRRGQVQHWPEIIATTAAIARGNYPFGAMNFGELSNHNNYDLLRIIRYGWSFMNEKQRINAGTAIRRALEIVTKQSMEPDGSFIFDPMTESSIYDSYYFGMSFLIESGFCSDEAAPWAAALPPGPHALCCNIRRNAVSLAEQSTGGSGGRRQARSVDAGLPGSGDLRSLMACHGHIMGQG